MSMIETHVDRNAYSGFSVPSLVGMLTSAANAFSRAINMVLDWQDRARERRQLSGLSESALKDFGASHSLASKESEKPFWRQ